MILTGTVGRVSPLSGSRQTITHKLVSPAGRTVWIDIGVMPDLAPVLDAFAGRQATIGGVLAATFQGAFVVEVFRVSDPGDMAQPELRPDPRPGPRGFSVGGDPGYIRGTLAADDHAPGVFGYQSGPSGYGPGSFGADVGSGVIGPGVYGYLPGPAGYGPGIYGPDAYGRPWGSWLV
jgi:hypothetical protein